MTFILSALSTVGVLHVFFIKRTSIKLYYSEWIEGMGINFLENYKKPRVHAAMRLVLLEIEVLWTEPNA